MLRPRPNSQEPAVERGVTIVAHDVGSVGGMERQLAELVLGLRVRGWRVTVIARTCELPAGAGIAFHRVRGPSRPLLLAYPWFLIAGSLAVRAHRRGVVQATGAIALNRVDSVAVHCCHQVYRAKPQRGGAVFRWYARLAALMVRVGERVCLRVNRPARVICVSEGVAEEVRAHYPRLAGRVVTIHNGVDTDVFAPGVHARDAAALRAERGIAAERMVAAFVGSGNKGLPAVLEGLSDAPGWELLVAGRGHVQRYRELAVSLGVAERIHWLGVVRDVQRVYAAADAFVLPSDYETFSLVTFEAAASGLPILATPVSGVCELIEDGRSGFLIAPEPDAIAARLRSLAVDPLLRERLGRAARQAALRFTWDRMVSAHESLYRELVRAPTSVERRRASVEPS
jgi:glycosyltransferase involved in cell wall biosynthesis